jgi:hypothetical protein
VAVVKEIRINVDIVKWIALALGALGVVVMAAALIVTPQHTFGTVSLIALGVGVIGLVGYLILDMDAIVAALVGRRGQYALVTVGVGVLFVAVLVALYIVVGKLPVDPIDFTEEQRYALSPQTLDLLANLDEEVQVYAFFTEGYYYRDEAEIWLNLYRTHSHGMLTYEFIDPDLDPGRAMQLGMSRNNTVMFRQGDRVGTATQVDEQNLTSALIQAIQGAPRTVYVLTGHGERDVNGFDDRDYQTIRASLELENITVQPLSLLGEDASVPEDASAVLVLGPMAQLSVREVENLQTYLSNGGGLLLLMDPSISTGVVTTGVQGVAYSHDGERLVSAGADDTARVWDASTGEQQLVLTGHTSDVMSAAFSPDDRQIATASADGTVRLWDATTGDEIAVLEGHLGAVLQVRYSPTGDVLASTGQDQALILWNTDTHERIAIQSVQAPMFALAYSSDGRFIATGATDGSVALWNGVTGEPISQWTVHTDMIFGLAFSPDDTLVYSAALDGTVGMVNVETGAQSTAPISPGMGITGLAVFPDGKIALALSDYTIRVFDPRGEGEEQVFSGNVGMVWQIAVAPDGESFATASSDGTVHVWSLGSEQATLVLTGHMAGDPLENYLANTWGIAINDDLVIDLETASLFDELTPVIHDDLYDTSSPITTPLWNSGLMTFFIQARSLSQTYMQPGTVSVTMLAQTPASSSWGETNPYTGEIAPDAADFPGPLSLAISAEDSVTGSRVVVVGDADVASNMALRYENFGNADFFLNAVNWLTQEEALVDVRSSETTRTFNPMDPTLLGVTLLLSCALMPTLILVAGFVVWLTRRGR